MQKIYFQSKTIILTKDLITDTSDYGPDVLLVDHWDPSLTDSLLTAIKRPETAHIIIQHADPDKVLEALKANFQVIQAAGGLVLSPENDMLLIFRRGKWDLPKGKLDPEESLEACAVREVEEETGLKGTKIDHFLMTTYHTYEEAGNAVLKESWWYVMKVAYKQDLTPQTDEDIEECRWVPLHHLNAYKTNMQPSVNDVLQAFLRK